MMVSTPRSLYTAFDRFPSRKGAAVHIEQFSRTLFAHTKGGLLYVLGGPGLPGHHHEAGIEVVRFGRAIPNLLERAMAFRQRLVALLEEVGPGLQICHFRDPWCGVPIVSERQRWACVYEINGLPSIELPSVYPDMDKETIAKIRREEAMCWTEADAVVVPANVIRDMLVRLGCQNEKIVVIPNGAHVRARPIRPAEAPARYFIYFGALQTWQGVDSLLRAFARLADLPDLRLVVCASTDSRELRRLQRLAEKLEVASRVLWSVAWTEEELAPWRAHALASIAPLRACPRNTEQGCSPLKILESMADGVPVIASDLVATRELISDGIDGRLVPPDRPAELARAMRIVVDYPDEALRLGRSAQRKVQRRFTWEHSTRRLLEVYHRLAERKSSWQGAPAPIRP